MGNSSENVFKNDVSKAFRLEAPPDATTTIGGKSYVYFGGDGYLGLQSDPSMISTACSAALKYGLGSATSRNCFTAAPVQEVEENAAKFLGTSKAYYTLDEANIADLVLLALSNSFDRAFVDEECYPFWISRFERLNGMKSSGKSLVQKELIPFKHCDHYDFQKKLSSDLNLDERPLLLTDGVFTNSGTIAPLRKYETVLKEYGESSVLIDDSHGLGVLGANGRGSLEYYNYDLTQVNHTGREVTFDQQKDESSFCTDSCDVSSSKKSVNLAKESTVTQCRLYMFASLAKAFGGFGVIAAGSELFVEKLMEYNQTCYAVPPNAIAAATAYSLSQVEKLQKRRICLQENVRYLRSGLKKIGFDVEDSPSPIVVIQMGTVQNMRRIQAELESERILVSFLPTRFKDARGAIRIAVFASHTVEMIDMLLTSLKNALDNKRA
ncbi:MAG: pyridoxal phosphate-dependent aminotransferase family protein [Thermoguttaceae bacterium]|nr:pyridoxal phosphate-dependent aminotransferase family protein [Thermoguttaceae bacterium]